MKEIRSPAREIHIAASIGRQAHGMAPAAAQEARESEAPLAVIFTYISPSALIGAHGLLIVVGNARDCAAREYTPPPVGRDRMCMNTLGVAQLRAGQWQLAIESLQKSMDLRNGGDAFDWFFLAMAHSQLGQKGEARQWYEKGLQWMKDHNPKNDELIRFQDEARNTLGIEEPSSSVE
jgi:Flp pilus assembly protein TadD